MFVFGQLAPENILISKNLLIKRHKIHEVTNVTQIREIFTTKKKMFKQNCTCFISEQVDLQVSAVLYKAKKKIPSLNSIK